MSRYRHWIQILNPILFILILISLAQADNSKKELLPAYSMSGIITGTFEQGKILLSSNDKIVIDLNKAYGIKPGDQIELFQPLSPGSEIQDNTLYRKIGLGIIIEKMDERKAVCIIDSSIKEISVGDLVRVVNPR
ncbi:MAG: hypothetical protein EHM75_11355 [Desulfobacteraceae bacterium]|nr:MAG: hypothetical protein EHM75_11355 [Desulfobacteraceae bacterium]